MNKTNKRKSADVWLFFIVSILLGIGAVMIYSTSAIFAQENYNDSLFFLKRHVIWIILGLLTMFVIWRTDYEIIRRYSKLLLFFSFILLTLTFIPGIGHSAGGARRWIKFGFMTFQPSEFAKLAIIIYLSDIFVRKQRWIKEFWKGLVPPLFIVGIIMGLILVQPDFGTTVSVVLVVTIILFVAGARLKYLLTMGFSLLPFLFIFMLKAPYRRRRFFSFFTPWEDPQGVNFQIVQSFLALGSGGTFGLGLGQSRQKLFYLPAAHTDFIFSIIGEELGLLGTTLVVALFIGFLWCGAKIALRSLDLFAHLLSVGIVSAISLQTIINIGVVTGSLPTKGLPLPFISFGGSSMIVNLIAVGILMSIHRGTELKKGSGASITKDIKI